LRDLSLEIVVQKSHKMNISMECVLQATTQQLTTIHISRWLMMVWSMHSFLL